MKEFQIVGDYIAEVLNVLSQKGAEEDVARLVGDGRLEHGPAAVAAGQRERPRFAVVDAHVGLDDPATADPEAGHREDAPVHLAKADDVEAVA